MFVFIVAINLIIFRSALGVDSTEIGIEIMCSIFTIFYELNRKKDMLNGEK